MWLIDVNTYKLVWFIDGRGVVGKYAILSHTWDDDELSFSDGQKLTSQETMQKKGFAKIAFTCTQAKADGLSYAWVDTCCINKDSSAELSEAINSMFRWYQNAKTCYVYLSDTTEELMWNPWFWKTDSSRRKRAEDEFAKCRWFTRGWTLQELLAPVHVRFFAKDWTYIGNKGDLATILISITGVSSRVILNPDSMWSYSISVRMSWAAERLTTREEDSAYCLLGILDVNIPLLYGEGPRAFIRLQEEILRTSLDRSILCWGMKEPAHRNELLAPNVSCFKDALYLDGHNAIYDYDGHQFTNRGLSISLPIRSSENKDFEVYAAVNKAVGKQGMTGYAVLILRRIFSDDRGDQSLAKRPQVYEIMREVGDMVQHQSVWLNEDDSWRDDVDVKSVVIVPHCVSFTVGFDYPEDQLEIVEAQPAQCFIRRTAEFHLVLSRGIRRELVDCRVKLRDRLSGETRYLCVGKRDMWQDGDSEGLGVRFSDDREAFDSNLQLREIDWWSLDKRTIRFSARTPAWAISKRDVPLGLQVVRVQEAYRTAAKPRLVERKSLSKEAVLDEGSKSDAAGLIEPDGDEHE